MNTEEKKVDTEELLKKIEKDTMAKLLCTDKPPVKLNEKELLNIMIAGADEFKEKTGRNMTYSEMRNAFG
jgi:hypothetical protein